MARSTIWIVLFLFCAFVQAQNDMNSLLQTLNKNKVPDTIWFQDMGSLISSKYLRSKPDSAIILANVLFQHATSASLKQYQAEAKQLLAQAYDVKSNFNEALRAYHQAEEFFDQAQDYVGKYKVFSKISDIHFKRNDYSLAFEYINRSLKYHEQQQDTTYMAWDYLQICRLYMGKANFNRSLEYSESARNLFEQLNNPEGIARSYNYLGLINYNIGNYSKAIDDYQKSLKIHLNIGNQQYTSYNLNNLGRVYKELGNYNTALKFFYEALALKMEIGDKWATSETLLRIGQTHQLLKNSNKAIEYCGRCLELTSLIREKQWRSETYQCLYQANRDLGRYREAIGYNEQYLVLADSIAKDNVENKLQQMELDNNALKATIEQEKKDAIAQQELRFQKLVRNGFIVGFIIMLLATLLFFRQRNKIKKAYRTLKTTQAQLIQSEKMASLGEMTAGIAHEIQNPLNFINNFSEVNSELIDDIEQELEQGNLGEIRNLLTSIRENEDKIVHHGKRADAIVKSMLMHSRAGSGKKELTDINTLVDEYLRLAYHGLRAKDKSFNAEFRTEFEKNLPRVEVVPQDIGRVLLNLINNAFYAVTEKGRSLDDSFTPVVSACTRKNGDSIEIRIIDNGDGISQNIQEKLFQPFFTTKPTGQGTGLGLSLSYDIIRAHGGVIHVVSKDGEGTEFIVKLPMQGNGNQKY